MKTATKNIKNCIPTRIQLSAVIELIKNINTVEKPQELKSFCYSLISNPFFTDIIYVKEKMEEDFGVTFKTASIPENKKPVEDWYIDDSDLTFFYFIWRNIVESLLEGNSEIFLKIPKSDLEILWSKDSITKMTFSTKIFFSYEGITSKLDKPYIKRNFIFLRFTV